MLVSWGRYNLVASVWGLVEVLRVLVLKASTSTKRGRGRNLGLWKLKH